MTKVFIVNDTGHNYSAAEQYGELVVMSKGFIHSLQPSKMIRDFDEFLKHSSPDDYILHSGPSIMNSIACALFAVKHDKLNLVIFTGDGYDARRLDFKNFKEKGY